MTSSPGDGQDQPQWGPPQPGGYPPGGYPPGGYPPGGYAGQPPPGYALPEHPRATTVLVLGILGLVVCGVIAPFAWSMGRQTLREIDAAQGRLGGRGAAQAGYVLGVVGSVMLGLAVLALVAYFGIFLVLVAGNASSF